MSVLVFGSINVDLVMRPAHLPVGGETVLSQSYDALPGGKGANQALAARRAGADVIFVGAVGDDAFSAIALANLAQDQVDTDSVARTEIPTGCAAVLVDDVGENAICVASGANGHLRASQVSDAHLRSAKILVLQQEVPLKENILLAQRAHDAGIPVLCNLAPARKVPVGFFADVDYLVVNEGEAAFLCADSSPGPAPEEKAQWLADHHDLTVVLTLGANGVVFVRAKGGVQQLASPAVEVVDTTGAGDTFTGYLAAGLTKDLTLEASSVVAMAAAATACTRIGAQAAIPYVDDLESQ